MPSLVLAEARLARKYGAALSMSGWSARVSRASADSLRHVADRRSVIRLGCGWVGSSTRERTGFEP